MSKRNKNKHVRYSPEIRAVARLIYESWDRSLQEHANRPGTPIPPELKSDTKPLAKFSLEARVCDWIVQNVDDAPQMWAEVLRRVETCEFLQKGYKQIKNPNLNWLFSFNYHGLGIKRVLDGTFDYWRAGGSTVFSEDHGV
jgi:hypothetical protein